MNSNKLLAAGDGLAAAAAFAAVYFLRNAYRAIQPVEFYLGLLPFTIVLLWLIFYGYGLYSFKVRLKALTETYRVLLAVGHWALFLMAGLYLYKQDYSRIVIFTLVIVTGLLVLIIRTGIRKYSMKLIHRNILVVGQGRIAKEIGKKIDSYSSLGYRLVGFYPKNKIKLLYKAIRSQGIDEVYLADPTLAHETILDLVAMCPLPNVRFRIVSSVFDLVTGKVDPADIETLPSLDLSQSQNPARQYVKRIIDIWLAVLGIGLGWPVWLVIMVLVKLSSPGPIIFGAIRVGYRGKKFVMYKFRTMYVTAADNHPAPKKPNDLRITAVGRWLRRTSLDELPQLVNILKGEMSVVGPRPEMPFVVKKYKPWQMKRLGVKPGLTGLWQVLGRKDLPLAENLEYDFYYLNNQSLLLDAAIILRTIPAIIFGFGAY